jgi:hypothetical protein
LSLSTSKPRPAFSEVDGELPGVWGEMAIRLAASALISGRGFWKPRSAMLQKGHRAPRYQVTTPARSQGFLLGHDGGQHGERHDRGLRFKRLAMTWTSGEEDLAVADI